MGPLFSSKNVTEDLAAALPLLGFVVRGDVHLHFKKNSKALAQIASPPERFKNVEKFAGRANCCRRLFSLNRVF